MEVLVSLRIVPDIPIDVRRRPGASSRLRGRDPGSDLLPAGVGAGGGGREQGRGERRVTPNLELLPIVLPRSGFPKKKGLG